MMQVAVRQAELPGDGKVILDQHRLKALRKQRGLSQDALAQLCMASRLCVSIASIKRAETGKPVLYRTASHLARMYERDLQDLLQAGTPPPSALVDAAAGKSTDPAEQRTVLQLQLCLKTPLPDMLAAQAAALVQQFGGVADTPQRAIFGLPRAYGSDAVRCLQCALALSELLAGQPAMLLAGSCLWPPAVQVPAELASWPDAVAMPVAFAVPIMVERSQALATGDRFVFDDNVAVPGLLLLLKERQPGGAAHYPLIGRHVELRQFKVTLETTLAYQCGHILYLRGAAGIGKSRLIEEFTDIVAHHDIALHRAVVLDFGLSSDATPLAQLARSLLGMPAATAPESYLPAQLQQLRLSDASCMHLRAILGAAQPEEAGAIFAAMAHGARVQGQAEAMRELIVRNALERPLLLVLEDIHWAPPELVAMLATLLPEVQEAPVIWLLSSRFERDPFEHTLRPYLSGLPVTLLDLAMLRKHEALELARRAGDADAQFHEKCVARAQGNPLFLTQLLLAGRSLALPGSLKNLVQSKLDVLSQQQRRGMRFASAIGQYFSLSLLREVLGQPDHEVDDCVAQYIVRPTAPGQYVFVHDLVMQGIYESMSSSQRDAIHVALARSYASSQPGLRAQHLHKARDPAAPAALLGVAEACLASHQYAEALDWLALYQRIDYQPRNSYRLQLLSGRCYANMGQTQRARAAFSAALDLAGDIGERIAAVIGLAAALNLLEELVAEEALLDEAIAAARTAGVEEGLAELYYLKGNIYFPAGNFSLSRQLHQLAQRHARSKDTEARALSGIGDSYYAQGDIVTAHGYFRDCLALCEQHQLAEIEASNRFMLGTARIYLNQTAAALDDALASAELARRVGNRRAEIVSRLTAGWALLSLGRSGDTRAQVEQALEVARAIGASRFEPFLNESLVRVLLLEGRAGEAHELALQAWDAVQRNRLHKFIGPWVLSTLALAEPDAQAGKLALSEAHTLLEQGCVAHNAYRFYVSAMECSLVHGDADAARTLAGRFEVRVAASPSPWASHHIALARASADWLAQPLPEQQAVLQNLLREGQACGLAWVMPLWRTRLGQLLPLD